VRCASTISPADSVTSIVMATSVVPKCESRACRNATLRRNAATRPVEASQIRRPIQKTTMTVAVPADAESARSIRNHGSQLTGQLASRSGRE
jgi:hypothetical protein